MQNAPFYENNRGINALLKLLRKLLCFAINCPALKKKANKNNNKKEITKKKLVQTRPTASNSSLTLCKAFLLPKEMCYL